LEPGDKFGDLYAGKEESEIIQKIGKIVEMRKYSGRIEALMKRHIHNNIIS
jgi:hypothetical protein